MSVSTRTLFLIAFLVFQPVFAAEPTPVIFDTDMANDCDDAGALAVLNALADKGEARILAVVTNRKCPSNRFGSRRRRHQHLLRTGRHSDRYGQRWRQGHLESPQFLHPVAPR